MHQDLWNAVSNLVHQHVLRELHDITGAMLAQLDAGSEVDLGGKAPTPEPTKPAVAAPSPKPKTIAREQRLVRAKQRRQAANGAAAPVAPPENPWPGLRTAFHAAIKARRLTRGQVAAELHVSKGSICGWLVPNGAPPSTDNIAKIRAWLDTPAPKSAGSARLPEPDTMPDLPTPAAAADWPQLRERLRDVVKARALSHAEIARVFEVEPGTVGTWVSRSHEKSLARPALPVKD